MKRLFTYGNSIITVSSIRSLYHYIKKRAKLYQFLPNEYHMDKIHNMFEKKSVNLFSCHSEIMHSTIRFGRSVHKKLLQFGEWQADTATSPYETSTKATLSCRCFT